MNNLHQTHWPLVTPSGSACTPDSFLRVRMASRSSSYDTRRSTLVMTMNQKQNFRSQCPMTRPSVDMPAAATQVSFTGNAPRIDLCALTELSHSCAHFSALSSRFLSSAFTLAILLPVYRQAVLQIRCDFQKSYSTYVTDTCTSRSLSRLGWRLFVYCKGLRDSKHPLCVQVQDVRYEERLHLASIAPPGTHLKDFL